MSKKDQQSFGDFQTPLSLVEEILDFLDQRGVLPDSVIEPTCGKGYFLREALRRHPHAPALGLEISKKHLSLARRYFDATPSPAPLTLKQGDFFKQNWQKNLRPYQGARLVIGNPPWVTSDLLGKKGHENHPARKNINNLKGIHAVTGKSNFDISEHIIRESLEWILGAPGYLAMLCKETVARKVLQKAVIDPKHHIAESALVKIDAARAFDVSVPACLLYIRTGMKAEYEPLCPVYENFQATEPMHTLLFDRKTVIRDAYAYMEQRRLDKPEPEVKWRSGVKHDCTKVMELLNKEDGLYNKFGDNVSLERAHCYPLLKSADIAKNDVECARHYLVTPQKTVGEETAPLAKSAPQTWAYLNAHADLLNKRRSAVYNNRPPFSIFGVGAYSFAPYKVAVSAFYNDPMFRVLKPIGGQPALCDDTVCFLPCKTEEDAAFICDLLNSRPARQFLSALAFPEDKRPYSIERLARLDIGLLAKEKGQEENFLTFLHNSREFLSR